MAATARELGVGPVRLFVDGQWRDGGAGEAGEQRSPVTGEVLTTYACATPEDVDDAVAAGRRAFDEGPWPRMSVRSRRALLERFVALADEHQDELLRLGVLDNGAPIRHGLSNYLVSGGILGDVFRYHLGWIDKDGGEVHPPYEDTGLLSMSWREPVGVVAAITPYNSPVFLLAQKIAPALVAGCTVVVKPSDNTVLATARIVGLAAEAGFPPGVLNLVLGGGGAGEALVAHRGVDLVSFTGSVEVGRAIAASAGRHGPKRVALELGGKSPLIVLPDAAEVRAVGQAAAAAVSMGMSGQSCATCTRVLVPRALHEEVLAGAASVGDLVRQGDPFDPATTSAPMITPAHADRVLGFVERAVGAGAELVLGGGRPGGELAAGNWVQPTVFAGVDAASELAQHEVFGPVLSVIAYDDVADVVRLANATDYGLSARIATSDVAAGLALARRLRAGTVGINSFDLAPNVPFGGYKASGLGREGGRAGYEEYTTVKAVTVRLPE